MPSAAQIEGEQTITAMLPTGFVRPQINIVSTAIDGGGRGIRYSVWPTRSGGMNGEYRTTIIVPNALGARRDTQLVRLRQLVDRHVQKTVMSRLVEEERLACDVDEKIGVEVDDDMPLRAWRINCPLVLRRALDNAGYNDDQRTTLFDLRSSIDHDGVQISIDDVDEDSQPLFKTERADPFRWVRRATIRASGVTWSQGMTRSYLRIDHALPHTLAIAAVGRPPSAIVDLPGLDAPGLAITAAVDIKTGGQEFTIGRAFSTLGPLPGEGS